MTLEAIAARTLAFALLVSSSALTAAAQEFNAQYLPFPEGRMRRFPLTRTELDGPAIMSGRGMTVSGVTVREEEGEGGAGRLVFTGRGKGGDEWRVEARSAGPHYEAAYEGDLDRNGVRDLVFAIGTGGNGLAPPTRLVFLTFDRRGLPALFEATGFFDPRPDGVFDLVDLDGDRRAELVFMAFDDGYWVTNLYRVRDSRWSRVSGRFAGLRFPAYTRFTHRPNHRPMRPARGRNPVAPDLLEQNRRTP